MLGEVMVQRGRAAFLHAGDEQADARGRCVRAGRRWGGVGGAEQGGHRWIPSIGATTGIYEEWRGDAGGAGTKAAAVGLGGAGGGGMAGRI